jgi:DNA-binding transcriptional regulator YdaS (Cro superfamily)
MTLTGMELIKSRRGMMSLIARDLNITRAAIVKWQKVPAERVPDLERITGFARHELRPDLYERSGATEQSREQVP